MAQDITIGKLKVECDTKDITKLKDKLNELKEGFPTVSETVEGFVKSLADIPGPIGLGIAAIAGFAAGLTEMVKSSIEAQTQMLEMSEAAGISIEKYQVLSTAMSLSGISSEKLNADIGKLSASIGQALEQPLGKAADGFKKLGISQQTLAEGDTEEILKQVAEGLDKYADSAQKTALERELLGKQGPQLIAAYNAEKDSLGDIKKTLDDYGASINKADAEATKHFTTTLSLGMQMFTGVANSITNQLVPGLQLLVDEFVESGKQGGLLRNILDGIIAVVVDVGKSLIESLAIPVMTVAAGFKQLGTIIGGALASIDEAVHGHFTAAGQTLKDTLADVMKQGEETGAAILKLHNTLWNGGAVLDAVGDRYDEARKKLAAFDPAAQKVENALGKLRAELEGQLTAQAAAAVGMDTFKKAQNDAANEAEAFALQIKKGTTAYKEFMDLKSKIQTSKDTTQDEVKGWELIHSVQEQYEQEVDKINGKVSEQTTLIKTLAAIAKDPNMTASQKAAAEAWSKATDAIKRYEAAEKGRIETTQMMAKMDEMVAVNLEKEKASLTLTTNEMLVYNQQAALKKQYDEDLAKAAKDNSINVEQLTADYNKNKAAIDANNASVQALKTGSQGFIDGFDKGIKQFIEDNQNMNTLGLQVSNKLITDGTTALVNFANGGKDAFKNLTVQMLQFFEQWIAKQLIVKALNVLGFGGDTEGPLAAATALTTASVSAATLLTTTATTGSTMIIAAGDAAAAAIMAASSGSSAGEAVGIAAAFAANGMAFSGPGVQAFASGGVVSQPTNFNMGLMGEAGPEAIVPLQRNSAGQLGIAMQGGGGNVHETHYHSYNISIHSNQDPKEIAKSVNQQTARAQSFVKTSIQKESRTGGVLPQNNQPFAAWGR